MTYRGYWRVMLGGVRQKIIVEEHDEQAPLMVMFHGGPWSPLIYGMSYRGFYPRMSDRFTLVWWDQYGCGANHDRHVPADIRVEDFADMAVDLVDALHRRYPGRAIILNGFSFGTYLTMKVANMRPDVISAVINVAPIMDMHQSVINFRRVIDAHLSPVQRHRMDRLRSIECYGPHLTRGEELAARHISARSHRVPMVNAMSVRWMLRWFTSREYRWGDIVGAVFGPISPHRRFSALWNSMDEINLWSIANSTKVPVLYIQGDGDPYVSSDQLRRLACERGLIRYVRVVHSGHMPTGRAWSFIEQTMVDFAIEMTANHDGSIPRGQDAGGVSATM